MVVLLTKALCTYLQVAIFNINYAGFSQRQKTNKGHMRFTTCIKVISGRLFTIVHTCSWRPIPNSRIHCPTNTKDWVQDGGSHSHTSDVLKKGTGRYLRGNVLETSQFGVPRRQITSFAIPMDWTQVSAKPFYISCRFTANSPIFDDNYNNIMSL